MSADRKEVPATTPCMADVWDALGIPAMAVVELCSALNLPAVDAWLAVGLDLHKQGSTGFALWCKWVASHPELHITTAELAAMWEGFGERKGGAQ